METDLEQQLEEREVFCESLRSTLSQKDAELEALKQHFQQLLSQRTAAAGFLHPTQYAPQSLCPPVQTGRPFMMNPSPNPAPLPDRRPFMEKIDYSKIQLRKTDQLDGTFHLDHGELL
jgi:hypothetical protein